ncbi:MAG: hypothetical protein GY936_15840 [Ignavibacteriae bacterium]|nr:hypothetical protein [Ignavibacteriota bacterium]
MSNLEKLLLLQKKVCAITEPELAEYVSVLIKTEREYEEIDEWDEDHALDLVMNHIVGDLTEEDLKDDSSKS